MGGAGAGAAKPQVVRGRGWVVELGELRLRCACWCGVWHRPHGSPGHRSEALPAGRACRGEDSREGRLLLGRQQAALLDLAAAVHFHSSGAASAEVAADGGDDFDAPMPARKRRRVAPLLSSLAARLDAGPAIWAPVLARLLLVYGLALPAQAYAEWLQQLAALAPAHFPPHFMADEHDADAALWLLRLAHALALAWPLHLGSHGGGSGDSARDDGLPPAVVVEEQWRVGGQPAAPRLAVLLGL